MTEEGKYIYCITGINGERNFGPIGIGSRGDDAYTICCEGLAAVVSNSPVMKYPVSRENTLAHQLVMEEAMKNYTVLPVRFGTIAENEEKIKEKVLKERHLEFKDLLAQIDNKIELGVKALWKDINLIFGEIVEEDREIKRLKEEIAGRPFNQTHTERMAIGEMVKSALEAKRAREEKEILASLKEIAVDFRTNNTYGDRMIMNAAFLVDKAREKEFDQKMEELEGKYGQRIKFKYVGPVPPCNFVEIRIAW